MIFINLFSYAGVFSIQTQIHLSKSLKVPKKQYRDSPLLQRLMKIPIMKKYVQLSWVPWKFHFN